jgi:GntR family transcriptional regulator of arabinose operon
MTTHTKYRDIIKTLKKDILSGQYQAGGQIPTQQELAKVFETTRPTISRAFDQLEKEGLILRRRGCGVFVPENVNTQKGYRLGVLRPVHKSIPDTHDIFAQMLPRISAAALAAECSVLTDGYICESPDMIVDEMFRAVNQFIKQQIRGVLFVPLELPRDRESINLQITENFEKADISVVLIDRDIFNFPKRSKYDIVSVNNFRGSYLITEHLIKLGCKKIAFISCKHASSVICSRYSGYIAALLDNGISLQNVKIFRTDSVPNEILPQIAGDIRNKEIDAVVCVNDETAVNLYEGLRQEGISVPDDVRITGFDDFPVARFMTVPLTTVRQPIDLLANAAVKTLLERIANPQKPPQDIMLCEELVVRQSCGSKK